VRRPRCSGGFSRTGVSAHVLTAGQLGFHIHQGVIDHDGSPLERGQRHLLAHPRRSRTARTESWVQRIQLCGHRRRTVDLQTRSALAFSRQGGTRPGTHRALRAAILRGTLDHRQPQRSLRLEHYVSLYIGVLREERMCLCDMLACRVQDALRTDAAIGGPLLRPQ